MERDLPKEQPVDEEQLRYYNGAQILLIKYMLHKGIITSAEEYAEKYAEIFDLLANGSLQTRRSVDWDKLREKVDIIRGKIKGKITSYKIFDEE